MKIELPWPPSVNTYYRNAMIRGRQRTLKSKKARSYKNAVASAVLISGIKPIEGRLDLSIVLHAPTKSKYDIDNRLKAILDSLQAAGVFEDDEQVDQILVKRGEVRPRAGVAIVQIESIE